ncbi:golgin subfamily A member 6-like protein 6 isoform X3 [Corvus cornix cornix]|uniref:golgin subfamily A member 6-like protein 6 isoform X3 n=1 Tax=Corvus cornix cornix TaxID=932674 RepID=UPI0019507A3B|nr:golgin subfamily A member 6-like protein 6 isoform X3 [Corvus cornix cornix]
MNLLLEQREALEKQVGELTSQLAASRESQATIVQRAQQDVSWAQEQSRQKLLEVEHLQKMLEEAEHQNKELQVHLKNLELEGSQWEEVARQNSGFRASLDALEKEKARLVLSLEEKNLCLRTLEEKNQALNNQVSQFRSALHEAEQLCSNRTGQLLALNIQMWALQDAVLEMEATQATREKQLLQELEESRAGERSLRDSVHVLEAEVSELRRKLQSSDDKALSLAIKFNTSELELRKTQAQWDNLRACNQELQQELEESEQAMWRAEHQKTSRETALEKEAIALKEEAVTLHQEVASLQRKLESLEKERKDVLRERELYEEQMRDLKKKNEMKTPEIPRKDTTQQLDTENEGKQEELEHMAAALKEGSGNTQILCAPLAKGKIAKEALKKRLAFLKGKSHPQQAVGAEGKRLSERSRKGVECVRDQVAAAAKDKPEKRELRRTFEVSLLQSQLARDRQDNLESCAGSRQEMLPLSHKDLLTS